MSFWTGNNVQHQYVETSAKTLSERVAEGRKLYPNYKKKIIMDRKNDPEMMVVVYRKLSQVYDGEVRGEPSIELFDVVTDNIGEFIASYDTDSIEFVSLAVSMRTRVIRVGFLARPLPYDDAGMDASNHLDVVLPKFGDDLTWSAPKKKEMF
jgi:hypothetical protein